MISINGDMRDLLNSALSNRLPCAVGTASKGGKPQISLKGSVAVYDDETISYWERAKRSAMENVAENPQVVIFYRNPEERINWRFHGTAAIYEGGDVREKVWEITPQPERDRDPDKNGVAIVVKIDKIDELSGNVLQERSQSRQNDPKNRRVQSRRNDYNSLIKSLAAFVAYSAVRTPPQLIDSLS